MQQSSAYDVSSVASINILSFFPLESAPKQASSSFQPDSFSVDMVNYLVYVLINEIFLGTSSSPPV